MEPAMSRTFERASDPGFGASWLHWRLFYHNNSPIPATNASSIVSELLNNWGIRSGVAPTTPLRIPLLLRLPAKITLPGDLPPVFFAAGFYQIGQLRSGSELLALSGPPSE